MQNINQKPKNGGNNDFFYINFYPEDELEMDFVTC